MLVLPSLEERVRIVSIDPGTNTLGFSVLDADISRGHVQVLYVDTLIAERDVRIRPAFRSVQDVHGDRHGRLVSHAQNIERLLHLWQPHLMVAEEAFAGPNISSFETLIECLMYLRHAAARYNPNMPFDAMSNRVAKKVVGAAHRGADKKDVLVGVQKLVDAGIISLPIDVDLTRLSDHAVDSIAIGYAYVLEIQEPTRGS